MSKQSAVSEKSTKGEILDAYREILSQVQQSVPVSNISSEEHMVIEKAGTETVEKIVAELSKLKIALNQTISSLTDQLSQEAERLTTIKKAIAISQKELTETQQIKYQAGLLHQLIITHQQKTEELEKEIAGKRLLWEQEQKEYQENLKRERTSAENEYEYQLNLKKTHDKTEQEEGRRLFAKEMQEKKEIHEKLMVELEALRNRASGWESELAQAIKKAVTQTETVLKREAEISAKLAKQTADGALSLAELKIQNFAETVKQQQMEITRLHAELKASTEQVKDIAVSAVEGSKKEAALPAKPTQ